MNVLAASYFEDKTRAYQVKVIAAWRVGCLFRADDDRIDSGESS